MTNIRVNITYEDQQLAEMILIPSVSESEWAAQVAILLPEGLKMRQVGIYDHPSNRNVMRLLQKVLFRLPAEAFEGPVIPERFKDDSPSWLKKFLERG